MLQASGETERVTENPDFFAGLPMQTAQAIVKQAVTDFNNWLKSLKAYAETSRGLSWQT